MCYNYTGGALVSTEKLMYWWHVEDIGWPLKKTGKTIIAKRNNVVALFPQEEELLQAA